MSKASRRPPAPVAVAPGPWRTPVWWYAAGMAGGFIALLLVYGPALNGPFLLDDTYLPYTQPAYWTAPLAAWLRGVRPMLMLTYWINYQIGGENTGAYHFVNVLLHLLNGGFIYLIVRKILAWAGREPLRREILSAFGAALFLFHPLQTESVSYIASRSETQSVFFFLAAYTVFLYRKGARASWGVAAAVLILFGAACLTKEHAAVLPALLLLTDYYWNPGFRWGGIRNNWRIYVPMAVGAAGALVFVWRVLSAATTAGFGMKDLTWYQYFFTECRAIWRYVLFFLFPVGQNLDHDFPVSQTLLDRGALFGLLGLIALVAAAWYYRRRVPVISYGVFVFLILLAPTSSIVPIRDTLVERRMYLPFVGFVLAAAGALSWWRASRPVLIATLGTVLLLEAALTYQRNQLWSSAVAIWSDSAAKSPGKRRPNFQLAYASYTAGDCQKAVQQFSKTAQLEPPDWSLLVDWALAADCAGNSNEALGRLQQALAMHKTGHIYSQIGMEYAKLGQYPQALDALDQAAKLDPNFGRTYVYRGNIYALQGNRPRAAEEYKRALDLDPSDQYARDGLMKLAR